MFDFRVGVAAGALMVIAGCATTEASRGAVGTSCDGSAEANRQVVLARHAFDPFPFIFLNLMLSMLAALQAPIIMMSQNRASAKDRIAAGLDYEINLRAELEIMRLHEKIDQMRIHELAGKVDALCERMEVKG